MYHTLGKVAFITKHKNEEMCVPQQHCFVTVPLTVPVESVHNYETH